MSVPEKFGSEYYRGFLSRQGKMIYDTINAQLLRRDFSGQTMFSSSDPSSAASDGFAAYKAIRNDHPEYFYLGYECKFVNIGRRSTLKYPILYSDEIIARIQQQLRKSICSIVRGTAYLNKIDKEKLVYERIAKMLTYTNHNDVRDHNIVGPILLSTGVCEGHNALLLLCFRRIGIPCIKVLGNTRSEAHCWTIAWINGNPVHCDVTWDNAKGGHVRFRYFNLSDAKISIDHFDFKSSMIPVCESGIRTRR